jgi:hypothetical protein
MQIKIIFENSGDEILFDAINAEVVEYYIDSINTINMNKFGLKQQFVTQQLIEKLQTAVSTVNKFLYKFLDGKLDEFSELDYLDQNILNRYHAQFVQAHSKTFLIQTLRNHKDFDIATAGESLHEMLPDEIPKIHFGELLQKLNLTNQFGEINLAVHAIEDSFNFLFKTDHWIEFHNPFPKSLITNTTANFRLSFNHLGRTLYNKYRTFDNELIHNDENSYDQLLGFVGIHLTKAETIPLSKEYIEWCRFHNREPIGDFLNIGNIPDLDNHLTRYRQLLYKNLKAQNKFSIHKG